MEHGSETDLLVKKNLSHFGHIISLPNVDMHKKTVKGQPRPPGAFILTSSYGYYLREKGGVCFFRHVTQLYNTPLMT